MTRVFWTMRWSFRGSLGIPDRLRVGVGEGGCQFGLWTPGGLQALEVDVDDGGDVEGEELGNEETADDGDAKGAARFGAGAEAEGDREGSHERGHGGHHDRTE